MNERIKELHNEAEKWVADNFSTDELDPYEWWEKSEQKFAELIVAECINEIAYIGKANEVFGDRTDRGGLNHILWTTETAIEKIKQHFGVDECSK